MAKGSKELLAYHASSPSIVACSRAHCFSPHKAKESSRPSDFFHLYVKDNECRGRPRQSWRDEF